MAADPHVSNSLASRTRSIFVPTSRQQPASHKPDLEAAHFCTAPYQGRVGSWWLRLVHSTVTRSIGPGERRQHHCFGLLTTIFGPDRAPCRDSQQSNTKTADDLCLSCDLEAHRWYVPTWRCTCTVLALYYIYPASFMFPPDMLGHFSVTKCSFHVPNRHDSPCAF